MQPNTGFLENDRGLFQMVNSPTHLCGNCDNLILRHSLITSEEATVTNYIYHPANHVSDITVLAIESIKSFVFGIARVCYFYYLR